MMIRTKNKGAVYNLNEVMVEANNASWDRYRLFHIETVLGTNDN